MDTLPATAFTHPAGTAPSAYESNVSFHGSGRTTRTRGSPVRLDTALMTPVPLLPDPAATVNMAAAECPSGGSRPGLLFSPKKAALVVEQSRSKVYLLTRRNQDSAGTTWR